MVLSNSSFWKIFLTRSISYGIQKVMDNYLVFFEIGNQDSNGRSKLLYDTTESYSLTGGFRDFTYPPLYKYLALILTLILVLILTISLKDVITC